MKMKRIFKVLSFIAIVAFMASCVKQEFDRPPITNLPVGDVYTIGELKTLFNTSGATQFNKDASVYGIVTMDEISGNIYKAAYIQDATGAINLRLKESGGLRIGDSIRVYLKNVVLSTYNNLFQLDNVHNDSNIVILANKKFIEPEVVTISQILTGAYHAKLIKLENVQFVAGDTAQTWSASDATTNRSIEDCSGKSIIVRTSNYAGFAKENLPNGKGSLIAVAGVFGTTWQLYVRTSAEVVMDSLRCGQSSGGNDPVDSVDENFSNVSENTDIGFSGWTNIAEAGTRKWQGKIYQSDGYAQASGYNSNLTSMVTWLVTPNVKMDQKKYLNFRTAKAYWEHGSDIPMTILVSSNFDGVNVATASWTPITATVAGQSDADNTWISSGDIDLSAFIPDGKIAVAFKYTGSGTKSTSMRVDDVYIGTETGGGGGGGGGGEGGTIDDPYTVEEAISMQNATPYVTGWVTGYIVGSVKTGITSVASNDDIHWAGPFTLATNVLIASSPTVNDYTQCVFVNMPAGSVFRSTVNLLDNPGNLGKVLKATGTLRTYFGAAGLRDNLGTTADFVFDGGGGGGGDAIFTENFDTDLGTFSHYSVEGAQVWGWGSFDGGCTVISGFENSTNFVNDDWLISPAIDLSAHTGSILNIRQAANYVSSQWEYLQVYISSDYDGNSNPSTQGTWTLVTVPNMPSGSNWTFVDSGDIDITAMDGKSAVYVAFRYRSSSTVGSKWEISKVEVK